MNIVIADPHTLCREALESYIRHADQNMIVNGAGDYGGLMNILYGDKADILLLDPALPGLPMMEDFTEIDLAHPDIRVGLIVSDMDSLGDLSPESAHGMFPKTLSSKAFMQGIYQVLAGERFVPGEQAMAHYANMNETGPRKKPDDFHLTQREKQVMAFLVKGATNKDIARALDLQVVTVKLHVRGICRKIDAKNRTQAALLAKENGWDL